MSFKGGAARRSGPEPSTGASGGRGGMRIQMEGVDPTFMSKEELRAVGAKPHPPGQHPGGTLHQTGSPLPARNLAKQLRPLYPLFAMVGVGLGLAVWHGTRSLVAYPGTELRKKKRNDDLYEVDHPQEVQQMWQDYYKGSHLRHLAAHGSGVAGAANSLGHQPPVLPGDDPKAASRLFDDKRAHTQN